MQQFNGERQPLKGVSMTSQTNEAGPQVGEEYIFFLEEFKGRYDAIKLLRKTKEHLERIGPVR
jgi:hypothetical protein